LAIWEVASILGVNRPAVEADALAWPADAPISAAAARGALAYSEGRERPRADDPPPTQDEWRRMVALAQGAKKRSG
jgi:hypothetical protein